MTIYVPPAAERERAVLRVLSGGRPTATHWMTRAAHQGTDGTRRLLYQMAKRGLVEPVPNSSGRVYTWRITAAGEAVLTTEAT